MLGFPSGHTEADTSALNCCARGFRFPLLPHREIMPGLRGHRVHPTGTAGPQFGASCCWSTGGSLEPSRPVDAPVESYLHAPSSCPTLTCWLCPASHRAWLHTGLHPQSPVDLRGEPANARLRKKLQARPASWLLNPPGSHRPWTEMHRQSHRNNYTSHWEWPRHSEVSKGSKEPVSRAGASEGRPEHTLHCLDGSKPMKALLSPTRLPRQVTESHAPFPELF